MTSHLINHSAVYVNVAALAAQSTVYIGAGKKHNVIIFFYFLIAFRSIERHPRIGHGFIK